MGPDKPLPYSDAFSSAEEYVTSLIDLVGNHDFLRTLCGGVHVLDFFTSDPPLYTKVLPQDWRHFFAQQGNMDLLDLLMREDIESNSSSGSGEASWRGGICPPTSLLEYIRTVRRHLLARVPSTTQCTRNRSQKKLARQVLVGMTVKKIHEVGVFASYIEELVYKVSNHLRANESITHVVDFGSGQNYLGRALASEPYNKHVVAIESKAHNAERAKHYDVKARLVEKDKKMRNKKAFRAGLIPADGAMSTTELPTPPPEPCESIAKDGTTIDIELPEKGRGTVQYVSHRIHSGDLTDVVSTIPGSDRKNLIVISLHSCGNLVHHGLRSLTLNPSVKAVAMVGCCYNLITERLGPATYKLPELRPTTHAHPRIEREGNKYDPDGFPMSKRMCTAGDDGEGMRLNITARMMAVQAPANWGERESGEFFKKHFYRALLQRIFLDRGVINPPNHEFVGISPVGPSSGGTPIIIGSLQKACYSNFVAYVRGALAKLYENDDWKTVMREKMAGISDNEITVYAQNYEHRQKELSVMWSLMAFSAGAVEAAIVVDRWLWLKEQEDVKEAWVESLFDYHLSPRNLVVVGIKQ